MDSLILAKSLPKLIRTDPGSLDYPDNDRVARACRAGRLVRLRRGVYVDKDDWDGAGLDTRQELMFHVLAQTHALVPPLCGPSAAFMWGIPTPNHGLTAYFYVGKISGGRDSKHVHRVRFDGRDPQTVVIRDLLCVDRVHTAIDLAKMHDVGWATAAIDGVLSTRPLQAMAEWSDKSPVTRQDLVAAIGEIRSGKLRDRLQHVLAFARPEVDSAGESLSRVLMRQLGFPEPQLQVRLVRSDNTFVAIVDFFWPEFGLVGEFDGLAKYTKEIFTGGRKTADVVIAEKHREDAVRALGYRVVRWVWEDLKRPEVLKAKLLAAGLPILRNPEWTSIR